MVAMTSNKGPMHDVTFIGLSTTFFITIVYDISFPTLPHIISQRIKAPSAPFVILTQRPLLPIPSLV